EYCGQRLPLDVLHDDVGAAVRRSVVVPDGADARMIERSRGERFDLKATPRVLVGNLVGRDELDRDLAPQLRILGEVDLTQTTAAQKPDDPVATGALFRGHGCLAAPC